MNTDKFDILSVKILTKLNEEAESLSEGSEQLERNIQPLKAQRQSVQRDIDKTNATLGTHSAQSFINRGKRDELNSKISKLEGMRKMSKQTEMEAHDGLTEDEDLMALAAQFDDDIINEDQSIQDVSVDNQKAMLNNAGIVAKNNLKKAQAEAAQAKQEAAVAKENAEAKMKAEKDAQARQSQQSVDAVVSNNQQSVNNAESKKQAAQAKLDRISSAKDRLNVSAALSEEADAITIMDEGIISAIKDAVHDHKVKSLAKKADKLRAKKGKLVMKAEDLKKKIDGCGSEGRRQKYQDRLDALQAKIDQLDVQFKQADVKLANTGEALSSSPEETYVQEEMDRIALGLALLESDIVLDESYDAMNGDEKNSYSSFRPAKEGEEAESGDEYLKTDSCMADCYETVKPEDDPYIRKLKTSINDEIKKDDPDLSKIKALKLKITKASKQAE